jgi:transcription-repair coupling factor (superfamily II helicase)
MTLRGLLPLLDELPAYRRVREALAAPAGSTPTLVRLALPDTARAFVLAGLATVGPEPKRDVPRRPQGKWVQGAALAQGMWVQGDALVVTARPEDAQRLVDELTVYLGDEASQDPGNTRPHVLHFPESEALPFERLGVDDAVTHGRLRVLASLASSNLGIRRDSPRSPQGTGVQGDALPQGTGVQGNALPQGTGVQGNALLVASVAALRQPTLPYEAFQEACHTLRVGQRVQTEALLARWVALGYTVEAAVEVPGTVSRRGGILDIYPPHQDLPARIELAGNTIESIRFFDPATQRSQAQVDSLWIIPAQEGLALHPTLTAPPVNEPAAGVSEASHPEGKWVQGSALPQGIRAQGTALGSALLDYLGPDALLVLDEPQRIARAGAELQAQEESLRRAKEERGELPPGAPSSHRPWPQLWERLQAFPRQLHLESLGVTREEDSPGFSPAPSLWGRLEGLAAELGPRLREGQRAVLLSPHAQRLAELLRDQDVPGHVLPALDEPPAPGTLTLLSGSLPEGFSLSLPSGPLLLLTDAELLGRSKRRRPTRRRAARREAFLPELRPGSYVVHVDHGIGLFVGTRQVDTDHGSREYLTLEYAEGDRLYVPPEHLDRLSSYMAPGETAPNLTRLGTQEWSRAKERAQRSAQAMAQELLALYAARQVLSGFAFSPDTPWQREMEDSFPYVETPDQAQAIQEVKAAMEQPHPMDRLVCGDVGYGKTEIALRAAFKAVQDGKQVALLCPTTILAQQHYATFTERLVPFPVRVEVLSRFRTEAEQRAVVEGLRAGAVDIVIGTHRLLQKDVAFKDLGLLVIDDEQRFGVAQKERFKQLRRELDVLTLTATPIPRTLYMALSGIRDMSTIETPPESRQPVRTFVSEYGDSLAQEAILRELDRGGQVFFLHNRVRDLGEWAVRLQALVPQARLGVGHGRMDEEELAAVMTDFIQGKIDVLLCTTIIEAGLDLPNVNSLIVHRPELLGLAQMYQLRGRVGRGAHRAYAYFLVPKDKRLTEAAERRLRAILAHQELGAGFRIAMKDLEIRGAGNLLGSEQSGHIHAIGFDLYVRLLEDAVADLKAQEAHTPRPLPPPKVAVNLPLAARIPEEYVEDLSLRLGVYQQLARVASSAEVDAFALELHDRFGPPPEPVANLLYGVRVKLLAGAAGVETVAREGADIALRLREPLGGARPALQQELGTLARAGDTLVRLELREDLWQKTLLQALERMAAFRERVLALVGEQAQS